MPARQQNHAGYGKRSDDGHVAWLDLEVEAVVSASQRRDKLGKFCAHFTESQGGGCSHQLQADAFLG
jgi:hypothetical protein